MPLITTAKPKGKVSFFEACRALNLDGSDICDNDWDWGIFLSVPEGQGLEDCEDGYDKFCMLLALNLKCDGVRTDWYTPCDVCSFIEAHRATFDKFFNLKNREEYTPAHYGEPLKANEDEGYYEVYMASMESLIAGNYTESDYQELVDMLLKEEPVSA